MTTYTDEEVQRSAKNMIEKYGADALTQAKLMLKNVIPQRDQEDISYWRDVIRAIGRLQF